MSTRTVATGPTPQVLVEAVYGNLQIKGWSRSEVYLQTSSDEDIALGDHPETLRVHSMGDCLLQLPVGASVSINSVHGGVQIAMLESEMEVGRVLGSLLLRDIAKTKIDSVYGELKAHRIGGDLSANQVLGNASIGEVRGNCILERVAGNLDLRSIDGEVSVSAGGNARVFLDLLGGEHYRVDCGGDMLFTVPENADAQATLTCGGGKITIWLPAEKNVYQKRVYNLTLGSGKARVDLTAGGMVTFQAKMYEWSPQEDIAQMEQTSAAIAQAALWSAHSERISRHAREAGERASARAQERMQRTQERLNRKLAAAQRKMERRADMAKKGKEVTWSAPGTPPYASPGPSASAQVGDEERLAILRMLEQKKITLAEAEMLLAALEEKGE